LDSKTRYALYKDGARLAEKDDKIEDGWIRFKTLADCGLVTGNEVVLKKDTTSPSPKADKEYHLEKKSDEVKAVTPSEAFYTRMITMKEAIQPQVDALFRSIFKVREAPPLPIKILFDFLDRTADELKITDPETIHIWKNNSLALRFWVNLINNPDQLFACNKTISISNNFSTIGQVLMDSCSTSQNQLGPGAPASKLLFKQVVDEYKQLVIKYYEFVRSAPAIDRPVIPIPQTTGDSMISDDKMALSSLKTYAVKYHQAIESALEREKKMELKNEFSSWAESAK